MHCINNPAVAVAAVAFLSAIPTAVASGGLYTKNSPVLQVDAKNYESLIARSNHTAIVEFYAPWCGHCQNLKPSYEKAAKNLEGLAKVAAVNCDEEENKPLCGSMGVQGFPTLKIVRPGKTGKKSKPVVEDYQGPRTAKGIVDAVVDKINNHVKRVTDKDVDSFLSINNETAKAILFTEKGTTSALLRSLAIDFLDVISFAQIRDKESRAVEIFGVDSYPTLVLLPGGDKDGLVYDGEMKKPAMLKFLSQAGEPNPDPAPSKAKSSKKNGKKDKKETAEKTSKDSSSSTTSESSEATDVPPITESQPKVVEAAPRIPTLTTTQKLTNECLHSKAHACVLAFVPADHGETAEKALTTLSELAHKHAQAKRHLFPFYEIHSNNPATASVYQSLDLNGEVELVAVNAKRGWWRHYEGDFSHASVESWIDTIRMNEGAKDKLPEAVIGQFAETETETAETPVETIEIKLGEEVKIEVEPEESSTSWQGAEPTPEATEAASDHDEL
ncbi:thioredoxin-domain-containing protein [Xylariaceae sp. FL0255]|nr:thioredoxin-domain-containing protein [Xylariaceae sp. FL0255]